MAKIPTTTLTSFILLLLITLTLANTLPSVKPETTVPSDPLTATYIPVQVDLLPIEGSLKELKGDRHFWMFRHHLDMSDMGMGGRKMGGGCGGMKKVREMVREGLPHFHHHYPFFPHHRHEGTKTGFVERIRGFLNRV